MHAFAFGSPGEDTWAVGWFPAAASEPAANGSVIAADGLVIVAVGATGEQLAAQLTVEPSGSWHVGGDCVDLRLIELDGPETGPGSPPDASRTDCLVRATGSFELAGGGELASLGWRASQVGLLEGDWESLHQAAAWFSEDDGMVLTALSPRGSRTRAEAIITAAVLGSGACQGEDPRLSSTYGPDGHVLRAGLELWLAHGDGDELYPLRTTGEAVGPRMAWEHAGVSVEAEPFCWYSRGQQGAGVYLLARR